MKSLSEFLMESEEKCPKCNKKKCICKSEEEECEKCKGGKCKEEEEEEDEVKSEKDFKEYAKKKFEKVYGDKLDEDKMNKVVSGILKDHKKEANEGDWGTLVGILNKSFAN